MAGGYRCSLGHAWTPPTGHTPTACPVCGDTVLLPVAERLEPAFAPTLAAVAAEPAAPRPPEPVTVTLPDSPSFSSLSGMPGDPDVPAVAPVEHGSVVPFGGGDTIDFMPRPLPPPLVPGYEIEREVGRGGMGVVYKARQVSLNRPVALKMILAGSHAGPTERDRFRREAEAVATLQNSNIVQIFEIGEANGQLYLALEYVEGGSLAQHLKGTPWSARDAADLVELLARAVHYAHSQGVVHRDLKPGNILLQVASRQVESRNVGRIGMPDVTTLRLDDLRPKITDFGLAKKLGDAANPDGTKTGAVMGTPSYIAPEQASGKTRDVGPEADVYALGAILYELLTGRPPFLGETPLDTVLQVLHDDPVPPKRLQPTVPRDLETICLKCLNKSPAKRYASADELAEDLRRFRVGEPIKARPLSAWGRGVKWARRHPSLAALGVITAAVTVALVSVLSVAYAHVREAVTQKEAEAARARDATAAQAEARWQAEKLAAENEQARQDAVKRNEELRREAERTKRAAFALQLAQIAAMCERDPRRALTLLEDETRCPSALRDFTWAYLYRLCQREERVYAEHPTNDPLHAVAYSPTGAFVATAGNGGRVRLWDPRTGRTWAVLVGNTTRVTAVAFSPDGGVVATAGADRSVRLWELPVNMLRDARESINFLTFLQSAVQPLEIEPSVSLAEAHAGGASCVAFSPDGRFLASGGEDGMIRWWDLGGWHLGHLGNAAAAAAGGRAVAAVLVARSASAPDGRPVWEARAVPAHGGVGGVLCLAFAASGKVLVSGGADKTARVWAPDGTRQLLILDRHTDAVRAVAVTPDGSIVATVNNPENQGSGPTIRLISTETGRDVRRLTGHGATIYSLAISPDGELLASTGFDKTVRLWGVEDGQEHGTLYGHELTISAVAFAPDRRTVVSVGYDATARVWHTAARPHDPAETMRDAALTAAGLSSAGTAVAVGDDRGRVQLHRSDLIPARPGSPPPPFLFPQVLGYVVRGPAGAPAAVRSVAVSPDGQTVVASTDAGELFVWRVLRLPGARPGVGPQVLRPVPVLVPRPVYAMAIDPTGRWLVTLDADGVRAWDLRSLPAARPDLRPVTPEGPGLIHRVKYPKDVAFDAAGDRLAVTVGKGVVVLAFPTGRKLVEVAEAHPAEIETVAFGGKAGELLATADAIGLIRVWRVVPNGLDPQAELAGHAGAVYALAFNPDGSTLASGGFDRTVLLWDPVTGQERAVLTGHADRVLRVQFLPDASALVTVSRDGAVKRWRASGGAQPAAPTLGPSPPRPPLRPGRG